MVQPEAAETRRFVVLMDKFFDCVNARSTVEAKKKVKPELEAYTDLQDPRFEVCDNILDKSYFIL